LFFRKLLKCNKITTYAIGDGGLYIFSYKVNNYDSNKYKKCFIRDFYVCNDVKKLRVFTLFALTFQF